MACNELLDKNWDSFINYADLYLHQQKKPTISYYMTHYYMSMVLCYMKKDYKNSLNHIVNCIIKKPTMAEFWCMLADIFYAIKQYDKAFSFYNNAKILGSRRLAACDWPMEISKYDQYPTKMIDSCKKMMKNTTLYYKNSE
jgi:tetratricopeptide (TPR) repeat protein